VAGWTDEVLSEPRAWRVVEALAAELLRAETLDRDPAWQVMAAAWGAGRTVPILELGRKWRGRLFARGQMGPMLVAAKRRPQRKG
jgi:hypothetical protein